MWWWTAVALAGGRLPDGVRPLAQELRITVDPARTQTRGESVIQIVVTEPVQKIRLHAEGLYFDLENDAPTLTFADGHTWPLGVDVVDDVLVDLDYGEVIPPGTYVLRVPFEGKLAEQAFGFYTFAVDEVPYSASQLQADEARTAFPCFDEPQLKIPFTVEVTIPPGLDAISNGAPVSRTHTPQGDVVRFATTPPIPTYALALLVGPYEALPIPGMPSLVWTVRGRTNHAEPIVAEAPRLLAELEAWVGTPLPYDKLDFVVIPEFRYGAMENPGAIVFGEASTVPFAQRTPSDAEWTTHVVAHEMSHLWFGDLVTMSWWDDFWLNESFAEWISTRIVRDVHPEYEGDLERVQDLADMVTSDGRSSARPLRTPIDPDAVFESVNFAVFPKGRALLDMAEAWLGEDTWRNGLRAYLDRYRWGNATSDDLFAVLEEGSGEDVGAVLAPFVDGAGAPLLRFERRDGGQWWVRQEPYVVRGNDPPSGGPWDVPVRLRVGRLDGTVDTVRVRVGAEPVPLDLGDAAWVHPAADGIGYYAWSLGDADLRRLVAALPKLTPPERMSILTSLGLALSSGDRTLDDVLSHLHAFDGETEPRIVQEVVGLVKRVDVARLMGDPELEALADTFVRRRLGPLLDTLRLPWPDESGRRLALRISLVGALAEAGDPGARAQALAAAERVFANPGAEDPAWAELGLTVYARSGGPGAGARLRDAALAQSDPRAREQLLSAVGQVAGPEGLADAFALAADPALPASEMLAVMYGIRSRDREEERDQILDLAKRYDAALRARLAPTALPNLASFGDGCSEARVRKAAAFYQAPGRAVPGTDRTLARSRAGVAECLARIDADGPAIRSLLGDVLP